MEEEKELNEDWHEHYKFTVDKGQSAMRIDKYLFGKMEKISRNRIQNAVKEGYVFVNEKNVKSNYKIQPKEEIRIILPTPPSKIELIPQDIPLNIVYEDSDIMIINKASGMVVHPGHGNFDGTLVNALIYHLQQNNLPVLKGNNIDRPGIVHRIDKETSGLMVIAKSENAMTHLGKQFFDHSIERSYQAIIWGQPDEEKGTIEVNIGRDLKNRFMMAAFPEYDEGKRAVTHYELLEGLYYISLVQCKLETGRTHQIRVHFNHLGHPIFNDKKYGGDRIRKGTVFTNYKMFVENNFKVLSRQGLHAKSLGFIHPTTNEKMFFESELPEDMSEVLERWRNYVAHSKEKLSK